MLRWLRRLGYVLLGLIGLVAVSLVVLVALLERGHLDGPISRQLTSAAGREVRLEGPIDITFGWTTSIALGPVSVGNPDWAGSQPMATVPHAQASISLPALLRGTIVLPLIRVDRPHVALVRKADGTANWTFGKGEPGGSGRSATVPRIERLELKGATATYDDEVARRHLALTLEALMTPGDGRSDLTADLGAIGTSPAKPGAAKGSGHVHLAGWVADPQAPQQAFDLTATSRGDEAGRLLALAGVATTGPLPGYDLTLALARDATAWQLRRLDARLGQSRLQGHGQVQDLAELDGIELVLDGKVPAPGDLMAAFGLARRAVPALDLHARGSRRGARNELALDGHLGPDAIKAQASTSGPMAELQGLVVEAHAKGTKLGQLLPLFGLTEKPVPAYALDATVERQGGNAARVKAQATLGDTRFDLAGGIGDIKAFQALDLNLAVAGKNPSDILDIFALPRISLPPYKVAGRLRRDGQRLRVTDLDGGVGNSDVKGDVSVDLAQTPARVTADLVSERLEFDDLAGLIGLPASAGKGTPGTAGQKEAAKAYATSSRLIPDTRIDASAWRNLDLDVRYRGKRVEAPKVPISDLAFHVVSKGGWLTVDPFRATIADGQIATNASLDGTQSPLAAKLDFHVDGLRLAAFLTRFGMTNDAFGTLGGRARLEGKGGSVRALAASADGRIALTMEGGSVDALLPQLAGLKTVPALVTYLQQSLGGGSTAKAPIRCMVADFGVKNGIMSANTVLVDTPADKMTVQGTIDLRQEQLDLMFHDYPRNPSIGSSRQPVSIQGPIKSPTVAPAPGYVENQTLGWILSPLAAVVPFVELGKADDHPCVGAINDVRDAARPH